MQLVLKTERTLIGTLDKMDAAVLRNYLLDNVEHHKPWEPTREEAFYNLSNVESRIQEYSNQQKAETGLFFAAFTPDQSELLALCSFTNIIRGVFLACNLGFSISKRHEGQGLMYEILKPSIDHIFFDLKLHRIMANYMPHNSRSAALLSRLGFEKEGIANSYLKIAGKWQDHVLTSRISSL